MTELVGNFDMPRSTVLYNTNKLVDEGLVDYFDDEINGYYLFKHHIFLMTTDGPKKYSDIDIMTDESGFTDGYMRFVAS